MKRTPKNSKVQNNSPVYTCKVCGAKHGGSKSSTVCSDCYAKGHR